MPRVTLIHHGNNVWEPPTAAWGKCPHPRERLRFDPRYALPVSCYCLACGEGYIHPWHGFTEEEIEERKARLMARWTIVQFQDEGDD